MKQVSYRYLSRADKDELSRYLIAEDTSFVPSLSSKTNLSTYAEKVLSLGKVYTAIVDNEIVGCVIYYANDNIHLVSNIVLVSVCAKFQGQHIATKMLKDIIADISKTSMKKITIFTNNPIALHIYESAGFRVISAEGSSPTRFCLQRII